MFEYIIDLSCMCCRCSVVVVSRCIFIFKTIYARNQILSCSKKKKKPKKNQRVPLGVLAETFF